MTSKKPNSVQVWNTIRLAGDVRRYGLFNGVALTDEHLSFSTGTLVSLGIPKWLSLLGVSLLAVPVIRFDRAVKNSSDRITIECILPTYILASQLSPGIQKAALAVAPKPTDIRCS